MTGLAVNAFLNEILSLTARDGNIAVIPEAALFAYRQKAVLRVVVPTTSVEDYLTAMGSIGVFCCSCQLSVSLTSGTWSQISNSDDIERASQVCPLTGVYMSLDHGEAAAAAAADVHDSNAAGKFFGYPECCIQSVGELSDAGARWPEALVNRSGKASSWNAAANRIVADWGGISPAGELFPCSLACKHAAELGKNAFFALRKAGLVKLAQRIKDDAIRGWRLRAGRAVPSVADDCYQLAWL